SALATAGLILSGRVSLYRLEGSGTGGIPGTVSTPRGACCPTAGHAQHDAIRARTMATLLLASTRAAATFEIRTDTSFALRPTRTLHAPDDYRRGTHFLIASTVRDTISSTPSCPSSALARLGSPETPLVSSGPGRAAPPRTRRGSNASISEVSASPACVPTSSSR